MEREDDGPSPLREIAHAEVDRVGRLARQLARRTADRLMTRDVDRRSTASPRSTTLPGSVALARRYGRSGPSIAARQPSAEVYAS